MASALGSVRDNGVAASKSFDRMAKSSDSMVLNKSLVTSSSPFSTRLLTSNLRVYIARLKALRAWVQYFLLTSSKLPGQTGSGFLRSARFVQWSTLARSGRSVASRGLVEVQVTRLFRSKKR